MYDKFRKKHRRKGQKEPHQKEATPSLRENVDYLEQALFQPAVLNKRELTVHGRRGMLLYLESLADPQKIEREILRPLSVSEDREIREIVSTAVSRVETDLEGVEGASAP